MVKPFSLKIIFFAVAPVFLSWSMGFSASSAIAGNDSVPSPVGEGKTISEIYVDIENAPGQSAQTYKDLAHRLISIAPHDRYTEEHLENALTRLRNSKRFETVLADILEKDRAIDLHFRLSPFPIIKDIRVTGAYPFFTSDIFNAMTLSIGDGFSTDDLLQQEESIGAFLHQEGYPSATAHVSAIKDPDDGHVVLDVVLDKGPRLIFNKLRIEGNHSFSSFRLKQMMKSDPWILSTFFKKRFVASALKKDMDMLTAFYREKGFGDCDITHEIIQTDDQHISVHVKITEGPFYQIQFSGNKNLSRRKLKKDMVLFKNGNRNHIGLKRIAAHIRAVYMESGFSGTQVKMEEKDHPGHADKKMVTFIITEGNRQVMDAVTITGNTAVDDSAIKKQMLLSPGKFFRKTYYQPQILEDDINAVKGLYLKKGYPHVEIVPSVVETKDKNNITVHFEIAESFPVNVSSITFHGLSAVSENAAREAISLKTGGPFRESLITMDQNALSALISEKGYPFVSVTGRFETSEDGKSVAVIYDAQEGLKTTLGKVLFFGNFKTKEDTLRAELQQKEDQPFSLSKMLSGQRNLRNMDIFQSVSFDPLGLDENQQEITLLVDVEEKKPYFFELGAGYETQRGFFFNTKAGDHNLLGRNKKAWISVDISQIGHRLETGYTEPRFFGTRTSMDAGLFWERAKEFNQDFGTEVIGASMGFTKKLSRKTRAGLNFRFEQRDQFGTSYSEFDASVADTFKPRRVFAVTPSLTYDTRDSVIQPRKGIYANMSADISKGIERTWDDFIKSRADARYYITPMERVTFAWIGRVGHLTPFGTNQVIPIDQLFFLGGTADVRGFEENMLSSNILGDPLGGRVALSSSIEARIHLGGNFELPLFYDIGKISQTVIPGNAGVFRSSVGTGLRYITPIGPVGLLYGKNLSPEEGESSSRIHFSIGYTF